MMTERPRAGDKHSSAALQQGAARRRTKVRLLRIPFCALHLSTSHQPAAYLRSSL